MSKTSQLIAVIGAKGGVGASCLAAAIAKAASQPNGQVVLIDLDSTGPGIEVMLGIEHEPGARWPEMVAAMGEGDGEGLVAALPRWGDVPVLSAARQAPQIPADEVVLDVCAGLLRNGDTLILDVPRPGAWTPAIKALLADVNRTYLTVTANLTGAAGAVAVATMVSALSTRRRGPLCELVVRTGVGGNTHALELEDLVGWPIAATYRDDRQLPASMEVGAGPVGKRLAKVGLELARQVAA